MADLAWEVNRRCDGIEGRDESMEARLGAMKARADAWEIQAVVGDARSTASNELPSPTRRL